MSTTLLAHANPATKPEWEQVHRDDLVTVYRKEMPDSDVLAFKGVGTLDAPIGKILSVVMDVDKRAEWMEQVDKAEVVRTVSPSERIEYMVLSPPWPIRDRDIVFKESVEVDRATQTITMHLKSVDDPARPDTGKRIRAMIYEATFSLTPVDGGKRTAMVAESHADPKGAIPKWIVNLYQKSLPRKTLVKLLERVKDPSIAEHPLARELNVTSTHAAAAAPAPSAR